MKILMIHSSIAPVMKVDYIKEMGVNHDYTEDEIRTFYKPMYLVGRVQEKEEAEIG